LPPGEYPTFESPAFMIQLIQNLFRKINIDIKRIRPENNTWLIQRNIKTILDIGANTGQFAKRFNQIIPQAKIYSFEPIKRCYAELQKNTAGINIQTFNIALGDKEEEVEINISQHTPSSSLLEMADLHKEVFAGTDFKEKETITVKRLDDVAASFGKLENVLVKIDVQGFEDRVIRGGEETLKKVDTIVIETSFRELYHGQLLFDGIYRQLTELGFVFGGNLTQAFNKKDGSILYAESLFFNTRFKN
jgi:FkbM family methyltransferase